MRAVCAVASIFAAGAQGTPFGTAAPVYTMMGSDSPSAGFRGTVTPHAAAGGGDDDGGMTHMPSNSPLASFRRTAAPLVAMGASNSPSADFRGTAAPTAAVGGATRMPSSFATAAPLVAMSASNSPSTGVRSTAAPVAAMGASRSPTAGVRATSRPTVASPQGTRAPTGCQDEQTFHAKDCPQCTCAWFEQDPAHRCTQYGRAQGAVRSADGRWHNANTACCVCKNFDAAPATASPSAGPVPQVSAGASMGGCHDLSGDNQQGDRNAAFSIKGCPDCTCQWMSRAGRCDLYGRYSGAIRDNAGRKWLKAAEACCVCGGGAH